MILQPPFAIPSFGFNPSKISGLKLWLKANAITGLNDGDPVGTWLDSSGSGNDVTQSTSGSKPLYKTGIINGLPTVLFDGSDDFMSGAKPSNRPLTQFIVTQPTLNTASQKSYAMFCHSADQSFLAARLSTNFWGTFTSPTGDLSSTVALVSGTNYLLEHTATTDTFLYQQGTQKATRVQPESGPSGSTTFGLGKSLITANRQYAGHIAELIHYDSVLSSGDRGLVETYLINKYAL